MDVSEIGGLDAAADAFLTSFADDADQLSNASGDDAETLKKKKVSPEDNTETKPADADDDGAEDENDGSPSDHDDDEGEGEPKTPERKFADETDDTYVKVKVGDEVHDVPVKDLKRLWGQEAALTHKSTEVARVRAAAEAEQTRATTVLAKMLEAARKDYEPYSKIDWFSLAQQGVTPQQAEALKEQAEAAAQKVKFLESETDGLMQEIGKKQHDALVTQAKATWTALSDTATGIPGWDQKTYDELRAFAVAEGMDAKLVNTIVDEKVIRLLHKAHLYDKAQKLTKTLPKPKTEGKKRIVKTSSTPRSDNSLRQSDVKKADAKLRKSGSMDDAANAFLARMTPDDAE